jgi:hypothetical protein
VRKNQDEFRAIIAQSGWYRQAAWAGMPAQVFGSGMPGLEIRESGTAVSAKFHVFAEKMRDQDFLDFEAGVYPCVQRGRLIEFPHDFTYARIDYLVRLHMVCSFRGIFPDEDMVLGDGIRLGVVQEGLQPFADFRQIHAVDDSLVQLVDQDNKSLMLAIDFRNADTQVVTPVQGPNFRFQLFLLSGADESKYGNLLSP